MKYNVVIQVLENGFVVSYTDFVSREITPAHEDMSNFIPLAQMPTMGPMRTPVERSFITQDVNEITNLLLDLRNKLELSKKW